MSRSERQKHNQPGETGQPGDEKMTSETTFNGTNYSVKLNDQGQFVLVHPVSENETFDSFDEMVESHPVCEEAREFFGFAK
jgi:aromatic ring-cleaving dioxygenase